MTVPPDFHWFYKLNSSPGKESLFATETEDNDSAGANPGFCSRMWFDPEAPDTVILPPDSHWFCQLSKTGRRDRSRILVAGMTDPIKSLRALTPYLSPLLVFGTNQHRLKKNFGEYPQVSPTAPTALPLTLPLPYKKPCCSWPAGLPVCWHTLTTNWLPVPLRTRH